MSDKVMPTRLEIGTLIISKHGEMAHDHEDILRKAQPGSVGHVWSVYDTEAQGRIHYVTFPNDVDVALDEKHDLSKEGAYELLDDVMKDLMWKTVTAKAEFATASGPLYWSRVDGLYSVEVEDKKSGDYANVFFAPEDIRIIHTDEHKDGSKRVTITVW